MSIIILYNHVQVWGELCGGLILCLRLPGTHIRLALFI